MKIDQLVFNCVNRLLNDYDAQQIKALIDQETDTHKLRHLASLCVSEAKLSIPLLERILELEPEDDKVIALIGWILWTCGDDEGSRVQAKKARLLGRNSIELLSLESTLLPNSLDKIDQFRDLVHIENDIAHLKYLASLCVSEAKLSIPLLERILELNPSDGEAITSIGWILWSLGEDDASREQVERARSFGYESMQMLSLEAALAPDSESKISVYERILEQDSGNQHAIDMIAELKG
jgi:tetratricopeptide (TPR) repeat protein